MKDEQNFCTLKCTQIGSVQERQKPAPEGRAKGRLEAEDLSLVPTGVQKRDTTLLGRKHQLTPLSSPSGFLGRN